jgi:hypothetical protein
VLFQDNFTILAVHSIPGGTISTSYLTNALGSFGIYQNGVLIQVHINANN